MTDFVEQKENITAVIPAGTLAIPSTNPGQLLKTGNQFLPPFWDSCREIFKNHGLGCDRIRIGFLSMIGINSAPLGYPLAMGIVDKDGSQATDLLTLCVGMVPENLVMRFPSLDPKILLRGGANFKGKTIAGLYSPSSPKASAELLTLLQSWMVSYQPGPVSWLMTINQPDDLILSTPLVLKLHAVSDLQSMKDSLEAIVGMVPSQTDYGMELEIARLRKFLGRLSPRSVVIPFGKKLINSLRVDISNLKDKFNNLIKILKIITIINNAPPITAEEVYSDYIRLSLTPSNFSNQYLPPLTSTKVDYYQLWVLMEGIIPGGGDDLLTPKQKRIFIAIRYLNLNCLENKILTDDEKQNDSVILKIIASPENAQHWADKESILRLVNRDGGEKILLPTLNNELFGLIQLRTHFKTALKQ